MRPLPSTQRCTSPQVRAVASLRRNPPSDNTGHQGQVEPGPFDRLLGRFEAAAALVGLDGGEPDEGEDVCGEGAGLALWPGQDAFPILSKRRARPGPYKGIPVAGPLVGRSGDGGGGQTQRGNAGARVSAGGQVAVHGEAFAGRDSRPTRARLT